MSKRVGIIGTTETDSSLRPKWTDDELQAFERFFLEEGVINPDAGDLLVSERGAGANLSVDVDPGTALIEITNTNLAGSKTYKVYWYSTAVENLTVTAADATHPRIDRVIAEVLVNVNPDGSASNIASLRVVAGTAAASPSAPAIPSNAVTLALISVPAGDTTIADAQITDNRQRSYFKTAVMRDIMRAGMLNSHATATGTDTIAATMPVAITAYTDKFTFFLVPANNNTGAVTINVDGLGAKAAKKLGTEALVANDLKANVPAMFKYDSGTDTFMLLTVTGNTPDGQEIGSVKAWPVKRAPANWLLCYGQAVSRATYASLFGIICPSLGAFTVTIATPGVFSLTAHGLTLGDQIYFTTTGALPTGLTVNTLYYVISTGLTADAFQVSATRGGAAVNTSGSQSGTHTIRECPYGLGDGSTTFNLPDMRGRVIAGHDLMGGSASTRMTTPTTGALGETAAGTEKHTLSTAEIPSHNHSIPAAAAQTDSGGTGITWEVGSGEVTGSTGGGGSHNNMQPYNTMAIIIKYA